jgi:RHS repeat-associated protein
MMNVHIVSAAKGQEAYDAVGNRLTSVNPAAYSYNASNELTATSAATYTYDSDGNTLSKTSSTGTTNYTWDFENRLASVALPGQGGTVNFKYDPFGKRIYKSSSAGTYVYDYDSDNVVQELNGGGSVTAQYTQGLGIDQPLALYSGTSASYYHAGGLGSVTTLTNTAGATAASYVYDSFGNLTASAGSTADPFQYTAREFDSETGVYYYRARYYNPTTGRFLSEEAFGFGPGVNLYVYAKNNPVIYTDPEGLDAKKPGCCKDRVAPFAITYHGGLLGGDLCKGQPDHPVLQYAWECSGENECCKGLADDASKYCYKPAKGIFFESSKERPWNYGNCCGRERNAIPPPKNYE